MKKKITYKYHEQFLRTGKNYQFGRENFAKMVNIPYTVEKYVNARIKLIEKVGLVNAQKEYADAAITLIFFKDLMPEDDYVCLRTKMFTAGLLYAQKRSAMHIEGKENKDEKTIKFNYRDNIII